MKVEHFVEGSRTIEVEVGEKVSVHGYRKGEKPSEDNEIFSYSDPIVVRVRIERKGE